MEKDVEKDAEGEVGPLPKAAAGTPRTPHPVDAEAFPSVSFTHTILTIKKDSSFGSFA